MYPIYRTSHAIVLLTLTGSAMAAPFETSGTGTTRQYAIESYVSWKDSDSKRTLVTPNIELKAPVLPNLEVTLETSYGRVDYKDGTSHSGQRDTELGAKWRFIDEGKTHPAFALNPALVAPTGNEDSGLGDGAWQLELPLLISKQIGRFNLGGEIGYLRAFGRDEDEIALSTLLLYSVSNTLKLGAEIAGDAPMDDTGAYHWRGNIGFKWYPTPNTVIDGLFGKTIENRRGDAITQAKLVFEYKF